MIWIRIVSKGGVPAASLGLGVPLAASFGDSVGDIGRGVGCTLVLPDPNREISRKQALVTSRSGRHFIRAIGANLDIELNGRLLTADGEMPLEPGGELRIGPYLMRIERAEGDPVAHAGRPASLAPAPAPARVAAPRPPTLGAGSPPRTPDRLARPGTFDDALKAPIVEPRPIEPMAPRAKEAPRPPMQAPLPGAARQNPRGDNADVAPKKPGPAPAPSLPQRDERVARVADQPADRLAGREGAGKAPTPAPADVAANDAFVGALYDGLGMPVPPGKERTAGKALLIGQLLRESLAGTVELLAARQIAKKNLGASATMLQTRGNNPLKFSPNVDAALTHLLGPPLRGFIGPRDAVHDAFGDLRAHQVAMLAGMRAALEAVLQRFDPVALEARLAPKGMMDQLMPLNRRARLWETFGEQYASILREVEDDWDALFGRAFLQAYERQMAELVRKPAVEDN